MIITVQKLHRFLKEIQLQCPLPEDIVFVCIGTDQSTGDSFGPLVGSQLVNMGFPHVFGTLADPCDSAQVCQVAETLPPYKTIIAIDASLGNIAQVGTFVCAEGPLKPGAALGKKLPELGDYHITAVVNVLGPKPYWTLQTTSLYKVMQLADELSSLLAQIWEINKESVQYEPITHIK